jgi:predicted Zn-dependent peptidase
MAIYAGTSVESVRKVVDHILAEFSELKSGPIPEDELRRAKDQLKGGLMLSLESSTSRMSNLARQEMYFQRFFTMDETIAQIESVTAEEVCEMAGALFHPDKVAVTVLGNLDGLKLSKENLVF